ncbi:MAG: Fe-Mn family superoxide dismutase [Patescibacteria group bacterium]
MQYQERKFTIPALDGISAKSAEEHLGLYAGYVKNFNAIGAKIIEYLKESEKHAIAISELTRRHSFEWGGMRLHELYFSQWEGGVTPLAPESTLGMALSKDFGSVENLIVEMKQVGMMRGPGWSLLYWDSIGQTSHLGFSGEQHQGHFVTLPVILALDVWEHAFILDYGAQGKGKYIDAFFKNLNWRVVEDRFQSAVK